MDFATTPCRTCERPIVIMTLAGGRRVPMDPALPVYHRVVDPDSEPRGAFWIEDRASPGERRQALAAHRCPGRS